MYKTLRTLLVFILLSCVYKAEGQSNNITRKTAVTGIEVSRDQVTLEVGEKRQILFTIQPNNATNRDVSWTTSSNGIAVVDDFGMVTAVKQGTARIKVTTKEGSYTAECIVEVVATKSGQAKNKETSSVGKNKLTREETVTTIPVNSVRLNKSTLTLTQGKSEILHATVSPDNATDRSLKWSSTNESVAIVNSYGAVVAKKPGTTLITVTTIDGSQTSSCTVTVQPAVVPVESISLNKTILVLEKGSSEKLSAIVSPYNATDKSVKWSSTNKYVANVTQAGDVVALKKGAATIWAMTEDGSKQTNCTVVVNGAKKKKTAGFFIGVDSGVNILTRFEKVDLSYGVMAGYAGAVGVYARGSSNFDPRYTVEEGSSSIQKEISVSRRSITGGMLFRLLDSGSWSWYLSAGAGVCERNVRYYQDGSSFDGRSDGGFIGYEVGTMVRNNHLGFTGGYVTSGRKVGNVYDDVHLGICLFF